MFKSPCPFHSQHHEGRFCRAVGNRLQGTEKKMQQESNFRLTELSLPVALVLGGGLSPSLAFCMMPFSFFTKAKADH